MVRVGIGSCRTKRAHIKCASAYSCYAFGKFGQVKIFAAVEGIIVNFGKISGKSNKSHFFAFVKSAFANVLHAVGHRNARNAFLKTEGIFGNSRRAVGYGSNAFVIFVADYPVACIHNSVGVCPDARIFKGAHANVFYGSGYGDFGQRSAFLERVSAYIAEGAFSEHIFGFIVACA